MFSLASMPEHIQARMHVAGEVDDSPEMPPALKNKRRKFLSEVLTVY
jgi:hypothetical protein